MILCPLLNYDLSSLAKGIFIGDMQGEIQGEIYCARWTGGILVSAHQAK